MAFLGKGLKADLQIMATEMGVEDVLSLKVFELREAILNSKNFNEEFCREQSNTIIEERKRREEIDLAERKRKEDIEFAERKRKEEIDLAERKRKEDIEFSERERKEEMEMAERKRLDELEERKRKDEMDFELHKKRIELEGGGSEKENKFTSPIKAQSNAVQAEDTTKNIVTAKIDASESTCNFLAENIDKLKVIKVKCLDIVLDGTVDSGAHAIPITCAVSKKLVNDMLVCQTAYEALLENIQLCSVNAREVIDVGVQMDEV
ncbi:hypothetical protein TNCT_150331 [Trichonephila clavata]|uniref:Uncharacterized protein n=1 Tax=Trichonephila clavata TaxID=2740835 RepID=A0A8X6I056_TRICU|nr:hypothetical protein TNCT_150331 [Trichonephila clavata]